MNFQRPMNLPLSGQEVALVVTGLCELKAGLSHELLKKIEAIDAAASAEENKPTLHLRPVSQMARELAAEIPEFLRTGSDPAV